MTLSLRFNTAACGPGGRQALLLCLATLLVGSGFTIGRAQADTAEADATAPSVAAEPAAASGWLERMSMAVKTLNYEGVFIQYRDGAMDTLSILHSSDVRGELERMIALTGEPREVIRSHDLVTCIFPDSSTVVVTASKPRNHLPKLDAAVIASDQYQISLSGQDRVAGHPTQVVVLEPTDGFRYGYRFWVDEDTFMLLRSVMLDAQQQPVEQIMFTAIEYPDEIDPARFNVQVSDDQITWREPVPDRSGPDQSSVDRVQFDTLPAGYSEVSEIYKAMPINDDGPVSHVVLSDGMASVSVYVEHLPASRQDRSAEGLSHMGAMSAYAMGLPEGFVTVVGEVPAATVQAVGKAVRLVEGP